jgi:hypothetical protein
MNASERTMLHASLVLALAALTCKNADTVAPGEGVPPDLRFTILPFVLGNQWVYRDSLNTGAAVRVISYTVSVTSFRFDQGNYWWKLQNTFNPSIDSREFAARGDSIFSLQYTEAPGGLAPVLSLEYLRPPPTGTLSFQSILSGDALLRKSVSVLNQPHSVPAGAFSGCLIFAYDIGPEQYREIVAPAVGVLECDIEADSSALGPAWHREIKLIEFELAE